MYEASVKKEVNNNYVRLFTDATESKEKKQWYNHNFTFSGRKYSHNKIVYGKKSTSLQRRWQ